jgi:O-antigen/teichoic acid export membrane protein
MIWRRLLGYFPASLAGGLASLGAVYALTRLLSPADYGFYALALTTMGIIYTLSVTWVEASYSASNWAVQGKNKVLWLLCLIQNIFNGFN